MTTQDLSHEAREKRRSKEENRRAKKHNCAVMTRRAIYIMMFTKPCIVIIILVRQCGVSGASGVNSVFGDW